MTLYYAGSPLEPGVSPLTTPGFVYFIQGDWPEGLIKIGWATKPEVRRHTMQSHSPVELKLLHYEPGTGHDERALHEKFKDWRQHGEWFKPCKGLGDAIIAKLNPSEWARNET